MAVALLTSFGSLALVASFFLGYRRGYRRAKLERKWNAMLTINSAYGKRAPSVPFLSAIPYPSDTFKPTHDESSRKDQE